MIRVGISALVGLLLVGCSVDTSTRVPLLVHTTAMTNMQNAHSLVQKRKVASLNCRISGYRKRSEPYYRCMRALIARDLQRTRERAKYHVQQAAERHGVCMDQRTYRVARCQEI
jgi:hypothetical protein